MKTIKINFRDFGGGFNPQDNKIINILRKRYHVIIDENPDFLFYSCYNTNFLKINNCVKIFFSGEAVSPDFNECDYAISCDYINFENRAIRVDRYVPHNKNEITADMLKRKFCNFIYSNDTNGHGAKTRKDFCKKLMEYKHVDCPGKVLNNMQDAIEPRSGKWAKGKLDFIKDYKFTIAFENCSKIGYVTEKLMQPLRSHSIPIYYGDPEVTREFNPKAFVNCHDFKSFDEAIEYIKYLDNNDEAYMDMLCEPPMQANYVYDPHKMENFLFSIIESGNKPLPKVPILRFDRKKMLILSLLQEASTLQMEKGSYAKAEKHAHLAHTLYKDLTWPVEHLNFISAKFAQKKPINTLNTVSPKNKTIKKLAMDSNICQNFINPIGVQKYSIFKKVSNCVLQAFIKKDAFMHCNIGNLQQAEAIAQNVIMHNPSMAWAYYILGKVQWKKGSQALAMENLQKAINLEPNTTYFRKYYDACARKIKKLSLRNSYYKENSLENRLAILVDLYNQKQVNKKVFILGLGATKTGTSWLDSYIKKSHNVSKGDLKEYHVFNSKGFNKYKGVRGENFLSNVNVASKDSKLQTLRYLLLQDDAFYVKYFNLLVNREKYITGDITPAYAMLDERTLLHIKQLLEDDGFELKVVFLMRDPCERCFSHFNFYLRLTKTELEDDEFNKKFAEFYRSDDQILRTKYDSIIENIEKVFSSEQIYYGIYEELFKQENIKKMSDFLGIDYNPEHQRVIVNATSKKGSVLMKDMQECRELFSDVYEFCHKRFPQTKELWSKAASLARLSKNN